MGPSLWPETKRQSIVQKHASSPTPRISVFHPIYWESLGYSFWDSNGAVMTEYLSKDSTIPGAYYASGLCTLREALKSKLWGKLQCGVLLLHDNAPADTSAVATSSVAECGHELLLHPPYSKDIAPSDFYLFPLLIEHLSGTHFFKWQWCHCICGGLSSGAR